MLHTSTPIETRAHAATLRACWSCYGLRPRNKWAAGFFHRRSSGVHAENMKHYRRRGPVRPGRRLSNYSPAPLACPRDCYRTHQFSSPIPDGRATRQASKQASGRVRTACEPFRWRRLQTATRADRPRGWADVEEKQNDGHSVGTRPATRRRQRCTVNVGNRTVTPENSTTNWNARSSRTCPRRNLYYTLF